jgi:alkyl hydroperoxide reductase subunit AhpC
MSKEVYRIYKKSHTASVGDKWTFVAQTEFSEVKEGYREDLKKRGYEVLIDVI